MMKMCGLAFARCVDIRVRDVPETEDRTGALI